MVTRAGGGGGGGGGLGVGGKVMHMYNSILSLSTDISV